MGKRKITNNMMHTSAHASDSLRKLAICKIVPRGMFHFRNSRGTTDNRQQAPHTLQLSLLAVADTDLAVVDNALAATCYVVLVLCRLSSPPLTHSMANSADNRPA